MDATKAVRLPRSKREPLPGAEATGAVDPNEVIDVTVRVRAGRGKAPVGHALAALAAEAPRAREHLSREAFAASYGADADDLHKVIEYAAGHDLTAHDPCVARRTVHLVGTAAALTRAFGVDLKHYRVDDTLAYRGNADHVSVPADLADVVEAVVGFDTRPHARPHFRRAKAAAPAGHGGPQSFNPTDLARLYHFPADVNGAGQVIGILELSSPHGSGYRLAQVQAYLRGLGLKALPRISSVSIDRAVNHPGTNPNDPQNADGEVQLDIEVAGAVAPGARIVVYFAPNTAQGFFDLINHAVHDSVNRPTVLSLSWDAPEDANDATTLPINEVLQAAAAMGVTVCVASGDNGSADVDGQSSPAQVDFPASSPWSLACGGTMLTAAGGAIAQEVVWNEPTGGATGGGVSRVFGLPDYQAGAGVPLPRDPAGAAGRGVPDVAGDADPNTGYNVSIDGRPAVIGGTSAVAPLWAGLAALLGQKVGKPVGFLNPFLYRNAGACNDITAGNNGDYAAGPGWDACTGLGSPDGAKLAAALAGTPPATKKTPTPAGAFQPVAAAVG